MISEKENQQIEKIIKKKIENKKLKKIKIEEIKQILKFLINNSKNQNISSILSDDAKGQKTLVDFAINVFQKIKKIKEKENQKIEKIIEEKIEEKKLENSKIEEVKQILDFLTNKEENISSVLGFAGCGKSTVINIAIHIFQKNKKFFKNKLKHKKYKKIFEDQLKYEKFLEKKLNYKKFFKNKLKYKKALKIKIDLWTLFGLKSKEDYCKICLPSNRKKLIKIDNNEKLNFYSYAPHQCIFNKKVQNNKLVITSLYIKKMLWTSIIDKICYEKPKSKKLFKAIKHEKIDINKKNEITKWIFLILFLFIGITIGLTLFFERVFNLSYDTSIIYSSVISGIANIFLFSIKIIIKNTREINVNETLIDNTTNEILNMTIGEALIERKIWFLKWLIKLLKYSRWPQKLTYRGKNIILHFENIDRLWDWLKETKKSNTLNDNDENNNLEKPPRSKVIIEILENIALIYKKNNIKILIEIDYRIKELISKYTINRKSDYIKRIIGTNIEIKSLNKNCLLKLEENWNNEEKILIEKIGDELHKHTLNSWRLKNDIIEKIKLFCQIFKKFIEIDELKKINRLDCIFYHWVKNPNSFDVSNQEKRIYIGSSNEIYIPEYDWNKKIEEKEFWNDDLLKIIYLLNNPFNKIKANNEKINLFFEEYTKSILKEREEKEILMGTFEKNEILKIKNDLYLKILNTFIEKCKETQNEENSSKIRLNKQFFDLIINTNYFNIYEIYKFFQIGLKYEKIKNQLIEYFKKYIKNKSSSSFKYEDVKWIKNDDEGIYTIVISIFLELLSKKDKNIFWKNKTFIKIIIEILHEDNNNWKNDWERKRLNIFIKEIWNKLPKDFEQEIFLLKKYQDFINDINILENFLKDFNFEGWKENEKIIIKIINNLIEKNFVTKKEIKELFYKHKEKNLTKKELDEWIEKIMK